MSNEELNQEQGQETKKETASKTLIVAFILCIVCSVVVAGAAVALKPIQTANKLLDRNKNILTAAGLFKVERHSDADVPALFGKFTPMLADLQEGRLLNAEQAKAEGIDMDSYDQRQASKAPSQSKALAKSADIAAIGSRERYASVYVVNGEQGIETIVLPVRGYGLWGTLYGFMALESDMNTVVGLGFYEHKETPGLGAKVDRPSWKAQWVGKQVFDSNGVVATQVLKGKVDPTKANAIHSVDGLSGATLTTRGVHNLLRYWLGEDGYGPLLAGLRG